MKKNLLVLGAALTLLLTLSACGRQTVIRTTDTLDQAEPEASAAEPLPAEPAAGEKETAWSLDPAAVTDDFAADTLIRLPELALSGLGFTFDTPRELTSQQLYLLFLAWSAPETLDACYNAADSSYIFSADLIGQTLDRYLEGYSFDISECPLYDPERGAVITPMAGAFGGNVEVQLESKTFDGNTVVLTALLDGSVRKPTRSHSATAAIGIVGSGSFRAGIAPQRWDASSVWERTGSLCRRNRGGDLPVGQCLRRSASRRCAFPDHASRRKGCAETLRLYRS